MNSEDLGFKLLKGKAFIFKCFWDLSRIWLKEKVEYYLLSNHKQMVILSEGGMFTMTLWTRFVRVAKSSYFSL